MRWSQSIVFAGAVCCCLWGGWFTALDEALAEPRSSSPEMSSDAELTDVQFVDPLHGWAVGDRGAIWRTEDGGRHWQLTDSPVNCRLESLHFLNKTRGWAVGGWIHPLTHKTSAVVLSTEDGGQRWKRLDAITLPALRHVTFFDHRNGWAVGNSSAMYPSGVFRTRDGGRSWTAVPAEKLGHWLGAFFFDDRQGILVGRDSAVAGATAGVIRNSQKPKSDWKPIRDVIFQDAIGWAVGDGGRVWNSSNHGATWEPIPLPVGVPEQFDFRCVTAVDDKIWIAGAPGTRVLHSDDAGRSWHLLDTGQRLPLSALSFVDGQHGWAVGAMGAILGTRDGGRTWQTQRGTSRRAALLSVVSEPERLPFEMLARFGGDEGFLTAVEIMTRRDIETPDTRESTSAERSQAAVSQLGGSFSETSWQFPLRQRGLQMPVEAIVGGWNVVNDGQGIAQMEQLVVRKIRQWQPEVIVTENASPDGQDPLAHVINQIVLGAVRRAADPQAYPQQLTMARLEPWKVKKVFSLLPVGETGAVTLQTSRLATRLGASLADQGSHTRGLVFTQWQPSPSRLDFQLLINETASEVGTRDFFSGLVVEPGIARREAGGRPHQDLQSLTTAARRRRTVDQLLTRNRQDPTAGISWLAQLGDLTRGLESDAACLTLFELSRNYLAGGHHDLAADVLRSLVTEYPAHELAEPALVWLIKYHASGEMANRASEVKRTGGNPAVVSPDGRADFVPPQIRFDNAVPKDASVFQLAGRQTTLAAPQVVGQRAAAVFALATQARQSRPSLFAEPSIQFAIASAHRASQQTREANHLFAGLTRAHRTDKWSQCARGELWLANGKGLPPKTLLKCESTPEKPKLDGVLDDQVWQDRQVAPLTSRLGDDEAWPTKVMFAHDFEFLYFAATCAKAPGLKYEMDTQPRPRDPDLSGRDRIELLIDIDRDFATCFRLTIDHRGWVADACWGDRTWDPEWYVAADATRDDWIVEAAIPLAALHANQLPRGATWAVGVQRTVPAVGFQSWTEPAATEPDPAGFGYLQFR